MAGMTRGVEALYRRLGSRYLRLAVGLMAPVGAVVVLGGVALLWLYVDLEAGQFLRILVVAEALTFAETAVTISLARRRLRPVDAWLAGERTPQGAVAAWRALTRLPLDLLRPGRVALALLNIVVIALYATDVLDGPLLPTVL